MSDIKPVDPSSVPNGRLVVTEDGQVLGAVSGQGGPLRGAVRGAQQVPPIRPAMPIDSEMAAFASATGRQYAERAGGPYEDLSQQPPPMYDKMAQGGPMFGSGGDGGSGAPPTEPPRTEPAKPGEQKHIPVPGLGMVTMGTPPQATALLVARILGAESMNIYALMNIRALLYVRAINGQAIEMPHNHITAQALMNKLGDRGMDIVVNAYGGYWPPLTAADLPLSEG